MHVLDMFESALGTPFEMLVGLTLDGVERRCDDNGEELLFRAK